MFKCKNVFDLSKLESKNVEVIIENSYKALMQWSGLFNPNGGPRSLPRNERRLGAPFGVVASWKQQRSVDHNPQLRRRMLKQEY